MKKGVKKGDGSLFRHVLAPNGEFAGWALLILGGLRAASTFALVNRVRAVDVVEWHAQTAPEHVR